MNISKRRSEEAVHSHKKILLGRQIVARPCRTLVLTDSQKSSGALESLPGTSWKAKVLENFLAYFRTAHEKTDQSMNQSFAPTSFRHRGEKEWEFLNGVQAAGSALWQASWQQTSTLSSTRIKPQKNLRKVVFCSKSPREKSLEK